MVFSSASIVRPVGPAVRAAVEEVAGWCSSTEKALNQCARAREALIDKLQALGVTNVQRIELRGPIGNTRPHPNLHPGHQVLRVGSEIVDVTWMQIDTTAVTPWKIYASIETLRDDWTEVRDWTTGAPIER